MIDYIKELLISLKYNKAKFFASVNEELSSLYSNGYYVQKNALSPDTVGDLTQEVDRLFSDENTKVWKDSFGADKRIYGINALSKVFDELLPIDEARALGETYLGSTLTDYFVIAGHISSSTGNLGSGGGWHRDSPFTHQYKMIVYLSEVNDNNGPFQYYRGSHTSFSKLSQNFPLSKMRFSENDVENFSKSDLIEFHGSAGDIVFVDTRGIHRGKPLVDNNRKAITVYFYEKSGSMNKFKKYLQN